MYISKGGGWSVCRVHAVRGRINLDVNCSVTQKKLPASRRAELCRYNRAAGKKVLMAAKVEKEKCGYLHAELLPTFGRVVCMTLQEPLSLTHSSLTKLFLSFFLSFVSQSVTQSVK